MIASVGPTPEEAQAWLDAVDRDLVQLQATLEPLMATQLRLQERRTILKELLASFGDDSGAPRVAASHVEPAKTSVARESVKDRVHRQALTILGESEGLLHINDLHKEFLQRGFEVPGAGRPVNITVHLSGSDQIVSPERGFYGLVEQVGQAPKQRKTPRPKRRRQRR